MADKTIGMKGTEEVYNKIKMSVLTAKYRLKKAVFLYEFNFNIH